ncbi:unnamed protein product [Closterium sp. NIES-64]|nr:unnamed protein product [Closterium sp. NIES-64]
MLSHPHFLSTGVNPRAPSPLLPPFPHLPHRHHSHPPFLRSSLSLHINSSASPSSSTASWLPRPFSDQRGKFRRRHGRRRGEGRGGQRRRERVAVAEEDGLLNSEVEDGAAGVGSRGEKEEQLWGAMEAGWKVEGWWAGERGKRSMMGKEQYDGEGAVRWGRSSMMGKEQYDGEGAVRWGRSSMMGKEQYDGEGAVRWGRSSMMRKEQYDGEGAV